MKKKSLLLITGLTAISLTALVLFANNSNFDFLAKATNLLSEEYSLTLDNTTKFKSSSGTGTAYTANQNPIDIGYTTATWSASGDFVRFNDDGNGKIFNQTAISGITKVEVVAKNMTALQNGQFDFIFSVGQYLNTSSYNQTKYVRSDISPDSSYNTYTFTPDSSIYNYFTIMGSRKIAINDATISIKSIKIYYSCSMSRVALRAKSNYNWATVSIDGEAKEYAEYNVGEQAQLSITYNTDEYEFVDWRYIDSDEIVSTEETFAYTVDSSTGFHDLYPHFAKLDCINVKSNRPGLGSAYFSDYDIDKRAYTDTPYTVIAIPEPSDVELSFFPVFEGWYLNEQKVSTSLEYTFTVPVAGAAYEMVAKFGIHRETFTSAVRLCTAGNFGIPYDLDTDGFVKSYDGSYYGFDSYINTWDGKNKGDCQPYEPGENDIWHQNGRGVSALTPYLVLNANHKNYEKVKPEGGYEAAPVKDFDPNKVACIELIFDKSQAGARDDISISGGASEFAFVEKGIYDSTDGSTVSRFCITQFNTNEIKLSIPDNLSESNYFKVKRVLVHYKIAIN